MIRTAILFHRIGPYHVARVRAAARLCEVTLVEYVQRDATYAWEVINSEEGFRRVTLFGSDSLMNQPTAEVAARIWDALDGASPEVVAVPGWGDKCSRLALAWCQERRTPAVVMIESVATYKDPRVWWKEGIKRRVVGLCAAAFVGGQVQASYAAALGMKPDRTFDGYDAVDNDYFAHSAEEVRSRLSLIRSELGLPEKYFLVSARLVEEKNLGRLIEAYSRYRRLAGAWDRGPGTTDRRPWDLVLVGDGPLREELEAWSAECKVSRHVHLSGFKQYNELPAYYGAASVFILPSSSEMWGLVVNEAMASGLPVLVSSHCGCARDLVHEGGNGFTFDPYNVEQIAQLMLRVSAFDFPLSVFGNASRQIIADWGPERFGQGLHAAVRKALETGPSKPNLLDRLFLKVLIRL